MEAFTSMQALLYKIILIIIIYLTTEQFGAGRPWLEVQLIVADVMMDRAFLPYHKDYSYLSKEQLVHVAVMKCLQIVSCLDP